MLRTILALSLIAWAAAAHGQQLAAAPNPARAPFGQTNALSTLQHRLTSGDLIWIRVYQEEELTTRTRIQTDGTISMPLLGVLKLDGKTVEQAQGLIRDLLLKDYLQSPEVSIMLEETAKRRFCILGEVKQPGFYAIPDNETMTILQAISMAGGFTPFANDTKISVKRIVNGEISIRIVNARAMSKKQNVPMMEIEANDTIVAHATIF